MRKSHRKTAILRPLQKARVCDRCGRTYLRRNLVEGWSTQNPGHRIGWEKTRLRLCTRADCGPANVAQQILRAVTPLR